MSNPVICNPCNEALRYLPCVLDTLWRVVVIAILCCGAFWLLARGMAKVDTFMGVDDE